MHLEAIKKVCHEKGLCLFIRPTELASTRLIKHGYTCKSVDIHAKSANGGLAKGFIPVDSAFCKNGKKLSIQPISGLIPSRDSLHLGDSMATFTTLFMSTALLNEYANDQTIEEITSLNTHHQRYFTAKDNSPDGLVYVATRQTASTTDVNAHVNAYVNPQERHEASNEEWSIAWMRATPDELTRQSMQDQRELTPLYVYAYRNEAGRDMPVTGDYDLAAIIPDKEYLLADGQHIKVEDDHGTSISSALGEAVVNDLNIACGHTVFRHGAETQNIHFAQPLDDNLIVITPARFAYVVPKEKMAEAQYDLVCRKKIIKWNPAYDRNDLPLSGQYFGLLTKADKLKYQKNYDELTSIVGKIRGLFTAKHRSDLQNDLALDDTQLDDQGNHFGQLMEYKDELKVALKAFADEGNLSITENKLTELVGQLGDILFYQEKLKAYLDLAGSSDAPTAFFCFEKLDFFEDSSFEFIEDAGDRARWVNTIKQVVNNTGDQDYQPAHPPQLSTTDDIPSIQRRFINLSEFAIRESFNSYSSSFALRSFSSVASDLSSRASTPLAPHLPDDLIDHDK